MGDVNVVVYKNVYGAFAVLPDDKIVADEFARHGCWEQGTVDFLRDRCFPLGVGTYVDAGAHIGLTTIPVALRHPGVKCLAFEPEAMNYELLVHNCRLNNLTNVMALPLALSDATGPAKMLRDVGRTIDHRMLRGKADSPGREDEDSRPAFHIETRRLDEVLAGQIVRPLVIKMDVQGHELAVLRGAARLRPDIVVFEYWPYAMAREGETLTSAIIAFAEYDFGTILLNGNEQLVAGLHLPLLKVIPWDGKTGTATQLVASRKDLKPMRKPLTFYASGTGWDAFLAWISPGHFAKKVAKSMMREGQPWHLACAVCTPMVVVVGRARFQVKITRRGYGYGTDVSGHDGHVIAYAKKFTMAPVDADVDVPMLPNGV